MGKVDKAFDPTNSKSALQLLKEDVSSVIDETNRQVDQLDSLTFQGSGSLIIGWDGTNGFSNSQLFVHGLGYAPICVAFYNLSTEPGQWQPCNDVRFAGGAASMRISLAVDTQNITGSFLALQAGSALTITINWFLQPIAVSPVA